MGYIFYQKTTWPYELKNSVDLGKLSECLVEQGPESALPRNTYVTLLKYTSKDI